MSKIDLDALKENLAEIKDKAPTGMNLTKELAEVVEQLLRIIERGYV